VIPIRAAEAAEAGEVPFHAHGDVKPTTLNNPCCGGVWQRHPPSTQARRELAMASRLVKTTNGYVVWGGKWGGPVKVPREKVEGLGLDGKFNLFTSTVGITDMQSDILTG
jgi:hypothetical protein